MTLAILQTRPCPFCAETIQARAVKCRFCGEFLNTEKARALEAEAVPDSQVPKDEQVSKDKEIDKEIDNSILFSGRPSLWGMAYTISKGLYLLFFAGLLVKFPYEDLVHKLSGLELTENQVLAIGQCRILAGFALGTIVVLIVLLKILEFKTVYYEVSADRIEWRRGILDRRVDNIDMSRVTDLKMRRSLLDCILDVGTIELVTTDKNDPEFVFEKVRGCLNLYDIIKKVILETSLKKSRSKHHQKSRPRKLVAKPASSS